MHNSLLIGFLGLGRRRLRVGSCRRSLYQSSSASPCQTASHTAAAAPAAGAAPAAAPKQLPGPPHGRRYLPAAVGAQLAPQLLPAAAASVTGLQRQSCVSITVQCSPNAAGTQILVGVLLVCGQSLCCVAQSADQHPLASYPLTGL
jgi:hypothetical protein